MSMDKDRHFAKTLVTACGVTSLSLMLGLPAFAEPSTLVEHVVSPAATQPCAADPAAACIDPALADHHAWFNPNTTNNQLLVYLPGSGDVPANGLLFQQLAAQLGYHVIGLMYEDGYFLAGLCGGDPDPDSCLFNAHFEIVYGVDTSTKVQVSSTNSIVNLLAKSLQYLATSYPREGWSRFLANGQPNWSRIALSGWSQGAGNSALIARYSAVPRVVMLSGVPDALPQGPGPCEGGENWLSSHVTPSDHYWGLAHDGDPRYPFICANWDSLGMSEFGPLVQVEAGSPPYDGTHMLFTELQPQRGGYKAAHPSTVLDYYTPRFPDKTPELADAWEYMLTAPGRKD
jgi:hypothetical protein